MVTITPEGKKAIEERAIYLIDKLIALELKESEEGAVFEELDYILPDPEWSDYLYHSDDYVCKDDESRLRVDYEKFFAKIWSYKPILL